MATESDLRDLLRDPGAGDGAIDVEDVIRRARRRRRPRLALAAAGGALAATLVIVPAVALTLPQLEAPVALSEADEDAGAPLAGDSALTAPTSELMTLCGEPVVELPPAVNGLVLDPGALAIDAGAVGVPVDIALVNTGDARVVGAVTSYATLALARDGVVAWRTTDASAVPAIDVDLEPGEAMTLSGTLDAVACTPDGAPQEAREDAAALPAGTYLLSAAIDFVPADDALGTLVVTGPVTTVEVR